MRSCLGIQRTRAGIERPARAKPVLDALLARGPAVCAMPPVLGSQRAAATQEAAPRRRFTERRFRSAGNASHEAQRSRQRRVAFACRQPIRLPGSGGEGRKGTPQRRTDRQSSELTCRRLRDAGTLTLTPSVSRAPHKPLRHPKFRVRQFESKALGSCEDAESVFRAGQPSLRTDSITIGVTGTSLCPALVPVATPAMASTTSEPSITLPNTQ